MTALRARERMRRALRGEPTDRPALAYLFLGGARHVLDRVGERLGAAYRDPQRIAATQIAAAELFGHDSAMVPWGCLTVEAEAFGCRLEFLDDYYPRVAQRPLADAPDLGRLAQVDPSRSGRMPLMVEALAQLRARCADDLFVCGMVVSPFLVAAELRGMSELLMDFVRDPPFVEALFERVTEGSARYLRALLGSGACDALLFENAGACRELLGPHHVQAYVMPYQRRLLAEARRAAPDVLLIEHNCADTPYFDEILALDVDAVSFAHGDVRAIRAEHGWECHAKHKVANACLERFCLQPRLDARPIAWIGNVDHTRILLSATPEAVAREARACIDSARSGPFALSTG
ncbi:MAG: uroporphyrinogen decarboxylase family protein, partial [Myxococcales bacterium]|nr:uroporphyrinogen decarboxylase family protein [Myxococcales bacterium]